MISQSTFSRPARSSIAVGAALLVSSAMGAFAGQPSDSPSSSRSEAVSLAGLNLATPEGLSAAQERVHKAARRLCMQLSDSTDLSRQTNYVACVDDAVANAMLQITGTAPNLMAQSVSGKHSVR